MGIIYTYIILQIVNTFFTGRFGFKDRFYQPPKYSYLRSALIIAELILAVIVAFSFIANSTGTFLVVLVSPLIVELSLFVYCTSREKKRLIKLFMNPGESETPMDLKTATETASSMVTARLKEKSFFF